MELLLTMRREWIKQLQTFILCGLFMCSVISVKTNTYYFPSPCRLSPETVDELTIDTVTNSIGDVFCGSECSFNEQCIAFSHKDNFCVLMSDPENYTCSEDGATYFKKVTQNPCTKTVSPSSGGGAFTMRDKYLISEAAISQIRVFYDDERSLDGSHYVRGLEVTWQGGVVAMRGSRTAVVGTCSLLPGEYIMKMEYALVPWVFGGIHVIASITFVTTHQTCALFGTLSTTAAVEGNTLLYFSGRSASAFDTLDLVFKSC